MNSSLSALHLKLTVQQTELLNELVLCEQQSFKMQHDLLAIEKNQQQSASNSLIINPEIEISRLNFLTQEQEKKHALELLLKQQQQRDGQLRTKLQRIKTELKMLERYMEKSLQLKQEQQNNKQQQSMDEWAIQRECTL